MSEGSPCSAANRHADTEGLEYVIWSCT
jgi:hypothetical protein